MEQIDSRKRPTLFFAIALTLLIIPLLFSLLFGLTITEPTKVHLSAVTVISAFVTFFFFALVVVELVALFTNKESSWMTVFVTFFLFGMIVTSHDAPAIVILFIGAYDLPDSVTLGLSHTHFFCYMGMIVFFVLYTYKALLGRKENSVVIATCFFAVFGSIIYSICTLYHLQIIPFVLLFVILCFYEYWTITALDLERKAPGNAYGIYFIPLIASLIVFFGIANACHYDCFFSIGTTGTLGFLLLICYFFIYFYFIYSTSKKAVRTKETEARLAVLQANILKNQMDPHFIFNALNVVKSLYRSDPEQGEKALDLLSKNLRAYTHAAEKYLVPLVEELEIVSDYVELESMKYQSPIEIIYDIDFSDFEVPVFSLQPLVENACRYSGITTMEDGYIEISARKTENGYFLSVSDNGKGFDTGKVGNDSYGMKNIKERFEILLNAIVTIESVEGEGTTIKIEIPNEMNRGGI